MGASEISMSDRQEFSSGLSQLQPCISPAPRPNIIVPSHSSLGDDPFVTGDSPPFAFALRSPPRRNRSVMTPPRKSSFGAMAARRPGSPENGSASSPVRLRPAPDPVRSRECGSLTGQPSLFAQLRSFGSRGRSESCNGTVEAPVGKPQRPAVLRRTSSGTLITTPSISAPRPTIDCDPRLTLSPPHDHNDPPRSPRGQRFRPRPSREPILPSDGDESDEAVLRSPHRVRQSSSTGRHWGSPPGSVKRSRVQSNTSARMASLGALTAAMPDRNARVTLVDAKGPRDVGSLDFSGGEGASVVLGSETDLNVELRCVPSPAIDGCSTKMQWVLHLRPIGRSSTNNSRSASPLPDRSPQPPQIRHTTSPSHRTFASPKSPTNAIFGSAPRSPRRPAYASPHAITDTPRMSVRSSNSPSPQTPDSPQTPGRNMPDLRLQESPLLKRSPTAPVMTPVDEAGTGLGLNANECFKEAIATQLFPRNISREATPADEWHSYGGYLSDLSREVPPSLATRRRADLPKLDFGSIKPMHLTPAPLSTTSRERSRFSDTEVESGLDDDTTDD